MALGCASMGDHNRLLQQANALFRDGQYKAARDLYEQSGARLGKKLVKANIALCERALSNENDGRQSLYEFASDETLRQQLKETQRLLEYYFQRCETLESKDDC